MIDWYGVFLQRVVGAGSGDRAEPELHGPAAADERAADRFRVALGQPGFQAVFSLGIVLFCAGLALGGAPWWQNNGWAMLAFARLAGWRSRPGAGCVVRRMMRNRMIPATESDQSWIAEGRFKTVLRFPL